MSLFRLANHPGRLVPAPSGRRRLSASLPALLGTACLLVSAAAQADAPAQVTLGVLPIPGQGTNQVSGNAPVTFLSDSVTYDRANGLVSATGHVQAWQGDHYLAADRVTFDRNTGVAAAYGHVVMVEPDGQIIFGDYAEVAQGMRNGIVRAMASLMADGGKMVANGARRTEGKLNELARGVYSSCNVCALHPENAPEWQLRANHITQDLEHKRIEFYDAWVDVFGFPLAWLPYLSTTDPSVHRQSGLLPPSFGVSSEHLGAFLAVPYFLVLDEQSDVTITPWVSAQQGGQVEADYRRYFNDGRVNAFAGIGSDQGNIEEFLFANANFNWDDTWRYGVSVNVGSSVDYLRDYQVPGYLGNYLASGANIEGFGVGSYTRLDALVWQGLNTSIVQSTLPYVLPRYIYSYFGEPDALGGRFSLDTQLFDLLRASGTNERRAALRLQWDRFFQGLLGEQYQFTARSNGTFYQATSLDTQPNYGLASSSTTVHDQPQVSLMIRWPFVRSGGSLGSQLIEPIVQLVAAPQSGNSLNDKLPNEDSLDYEFTDATLFSLNRFGGYDRDDGGERANFALHTSWTFPGGQVLDSLVGASAIEHIDRNLYPQFQPWNGFNQGSHLSDIVGRVSLVPNKWFSFVARARVDHDTGDIRFADGVASVGNDHLRLNGGYFYGSTNPYALYTGDFLVPGYLTPKNIYAASFFVPRNEATLGFSSKWGHYSLSANVRQNLETASPDGVDAHARYEDECTIFDILLNKRYTSLNGDHGDTIVLFTITLKTVGQFGFK